MTNPPSADELRRYYSFEAGYHTVFRDDRREIDHRKALARRQIGRLARFATPGRLVDVGATAGFFVRAAVDSGWDASGVELSADTARLAAERYGIDVFCGTLADAPVAAASLDAMTMWDVLEHVERPREELQRAATLVREGGILGISTPNIDGWYPRLDYMARFVTGRWRAVEPPAHLTQFSQATLTKLLATTGWDVVAVEHEATPLSYTFGTWRTLRSPKRLAYALVLAPVVVLAPRFQAGDALVVFARRTER